MARAAGRRTGWTLAVLGWAGFWAEAVMRPAFLPLILLSAVSFLGLGLGAYDQHRRRPASLHGKGSRPPALKS